MKKLLILAPSILAVVAACSAAGGPTATPSNGPTDSMLPTQPAEAVICETGRESGDEMVSIVDFAFEPTAVTVAVGQIVAWTNTGQSPHTVTFNDGPDCGRRGAGDSVAAQFNEPGEYAYRCDIHPTMRASVTVTP